ncbi:MAG: type II secretion system GspH family protein [Heliobacteriaceae bacterium]|jgi:prepilin-type N-terminal cleavage/methylation domain-containing protein|nr:type II secretion system GspH family protein [Heliobacteriaceae bacterium]
MKNRAFTLAEVLITLGIIGVVAALVMPALMANYKKQMTVTRLKETYSMLTQAVKMSEVNNGEIKDWNFSACKTGEKCFEQYLMPYLKVVKKESMSTLRNRAKFLQISGADESGLMLMRPANGIAYTLANGAVLFTSNAAVSSGFSIATDIDGIKPVNQFGKDMFYYVLNVKYGLVPLGYMDSSTEESYGDYDRTKIIKGVNSYKYACNKQSRGMWCTALIMIDGWQIKDDYPW